jgi:general secretion pathway protein A
VANARENRAPAGAPGLRDLLASAAVHADRRSAFTSLYGSWQVPFDGAEGTLGCERGRPEGLVCLFKTGTWARLRRYNLPAIIELSAPSGERRYATVLSLDDDRATLDLAGRQHTFPLREIDRHWEGVFILLWRAPGLSSTSIVPGMRSKDVEWVRQRLGEVDGVPAPARNRDVFDEDLRARVVAFQRSRSLAADGIVGEETLIHLTTAVRDARVPRLTAVSS